MGGMSRQKGKRGEREAAAELGALLGVDARRGVQYQGGPGSPDVVLKGVAIHVEAKRTEKLTLWPAIDQAKADAPAGSVPIVWHRPNRRGSVIVVETARLLELAREIVRVADGPQDASSDATSHAESPRVLPAL
jgi:Holliday junction resolvase